MEVLEVLRETSGGAYGMFEVEGSPALSKGGSRPSFENIVIMSVCVNVGKFLGCKLHVM